jgi:hypothetical protein
MISKQFCLDLVNGIESYFVQIVNMVDVARNDPCPCGSGKKYKKCCLPIVEQIYRLTGTRETRIPLRAFAEGNGVDVGFAKSFYCNDNIDLLTWKTTELVLLQNLTEFIKSIELCISNKFLNSALKLTYSAIDNLAYLETESPSVHKPDFIKWASLYLLPNSELSCTAEELYASRCGMLHQNTAALYNLSKGMKRLCYTWGTAKPADLIEKASESTRQQYKFVNIDSLKNALYEGIVKFLNSIAQQQSIKKRVLQKAEKLFVNIDEKQVKSSGDL